MLRKRNLFTVLLMFGCLSLAFTPNSRAQSSGNAGSVEGTILDPDGKIIIGASVELHNPVSGYDMKVKSNDRASFASRTSRLTLTT
jgi:hypothetical protein